MEERKKHTEKRRRLSPIMAPAEAHRNKKNFTLGLDFCELWTVEWVAY